MNEPTPATPSGTEAKTSAPHPFLWPSLVALVAAVAAGLTVEGITPGYALNSEVVYRVEVATAVFVALYAVTLVLWLAAQGRSVKRVELPGGPAVDLPDPALETAASAFDSFQQEVNERLDKHDEIFAAVDNRLVDLER